MTAVLKPFQRFLHIPSSTRDIERKARDLAWLIEESIDSARRLLARIYGFESVENVLQIINSGCRTLTLTRQAPGSNGAHRILELIADLKGVPIGDLAPRSQLAAELDFFSSEHVYEDRCRDLLSRATHLETLFSATAPSYPTDYAYIDSQGEAAALVFLPQGSAIMGILLDRALHSSWFGGAELCNPIAHQIAALRMRHPNNPWIAANHLWSEFHRQYQAQWFNYSEYSHHGPIIPLADAQYLSQKHAPKLLSDAEKCLEQFEEIFQQEAYDARSGIYTHDDAEAYLQTIHLAGIIALNAGKTERAIALFEREFVLSSGRRYRQDDYLAALYLNDPSRSPMQLFPITDKSFQPEKLNAWNLICVAAKAASLGNHALAAVSLSHAFFQTPHALDALGCPDKPFDTKMQSCWDTSGYMSELVVRTSPFWSRHQDVGDSFRKLCSNTKLREMLHALHSKSGRNTNTGACIKLELLRSAIKQHVFALLRTK